ncbi:hypothetical protein ACOME3_006774 [Neoechinorhynchus agilis]
MSTLSPGDEGGIQSLMEIHTKVLELLEQQERQSAILERWTEEKDLTQRISSLSVFKTFDGEKQARMEYVGQLEQHFEVNGIVDSGKNEDVFFPGSVRLCSKS